MLIGHFASCLALVCVAPLMAGGPTTITRTQPSLDRWNYPLNATPGSRSAASVFGVVGAEMTEGLTFDQRDAQFLLGWDLQPELSAIDCPVEDLVVTDAVVTITVSNNNNFIYDASFDSYTSHLPVGDPDATTDADPGRPIELFGVDYRNGFDQATFVENTTFGVAAWEGRNCFPIDLDAMGAPRDVSNNVSGSPTGIGPLDPFDPTPFAIGTIDSVTPADPVPANSVMTFTLDVSDPNVQQYLRDALATGELRLMVTSLQFAAFQTMDGAFAAFYTKENIFSSGRRATLSLTVECQPASDCLADFNDSGAVDIVDFSRFSTAFNTSVGDPGYDPDADINNTGTIDIVDFTLFASEFGRTDC